MKFKDIFLIPNLVTIAILIITIYLFLNLTPDVFSITNLILIIAIWLEWLTGIVIVPTDV